MLVALYVAAYDDLFCPQARNLQEQILVKFLIYAFGVIPIWIGLAVLIGRALRNRLGVKLLASRLWGFVLSPALMFGAVVSFAAIYNQLPTS